MRILGPGNAARAPLALAIGNFDGVHRGHQELLRVARARGEAIGAEAGVLTFTPHPARVFAPTLAPPLIVSLERRLELLADAGAEVAIVEPFTRAFAAIEAEAFVRDVLVARLDAREIVVGYDFTFGRGRRGTPALLQAEGAALGLGVTVVPPVTLDGGLVCSSSKVRELVLEGRVEGAALVLGRPVEITGPVVHGAGRGRGIGVPTANVAAEAELLPRLGIYAAWARVLDARGGVASSHRAALSVGSNPTFAAAPGASPVTVEAHLLDFDGDLYDRRLRLEVVHWLRDERRFDALEALVAQIAADVAETRKRLP
ncbi:MAG TPA: bifunctional riboflavin kinase/FAD synthetase [Polyangia bacterium]|nr:bifunctional riboflavin kinase/FAD synthetase [Polyangia bacterium]